MNTGNTSSGGGMGGRKPAQRPSREEMAHAEVGHTEVTPALARVLMSSFLALVFGVPLAQNAWELVRYRRGERDAALPQCWEIWRSPVDAWRGVREEPGGAWARTTAGNRALLGDIHRYEDDLEDGSWLAKVVMPAVQTVLTRGFGLGNEKTYVGRGEWLYYRPEIEHLTGRGYLDPRQLKRRAESGDTLKDAPQPDPVEAILRFRDQLAKHGVELIVMPAPVKATVHPERFVASLAASPGPVRNLSDGEFAARLRKEGVTVFDAAETLDAFHRARGPAYLATDTHWRPEAMDDVARRLAAEIERRLGPPAVPVAYTDLEQAVTNRGDLAAMLTLIDESWPAAEIATIRPVRAPDGKPWAVDRSAEVLLLGDSFCNIFSLESMGWGASAGLAERLSLHLRRPLDRIARNDAGAHATRQMLAMDLARKPDRLKGKKIVVWEFSARELSIGDWKRMDMR